MILPRQQADAIASQRKTTHHTTHDTLRVGARLPIMVRDHDGTRTVCHAQIIGIERRELRDLTRDEAKREGYPGVRGPLNFKRAWLIHHDKSWMSRSGQDQFDRTDEEIAQRFLKHTGTIVHVLTLALAEEPDQWMTRSSGRLTARQATSNPRNAIDELPLAPQAFVDAEAKRIYEARTTDQSSQRRAEAAVRFAHAEAQARAAGLDTRRAARSVEQIAKALERRTPRHEAM
jgi:hypothetical protein